MSASIARMITRGIAALVACGALIAVAAPADASHRATAPSYRLTVTTDCDSFDLSALAMEGTHRVRVVDVAPKVWRTGFFRHVSPGNELALTYQYANPGEHQWKAYVDGDLVRRFKTGC